MEFTDPTLLGVAAVLTSISGIVTTVVGSRRSAREAKDKSDEECRDRLRSARAEAEELAQALHRIRMSTLIDPEEEKRVGDVLERWSHLE